MKTTHYLIIGAVVAVVLYMFFLKPKKAKSETASTVPIGRPGTPKPNDPMQRPNSSKASAESDVTAPNMVIPVMTPVHSSQPSQPSGMIAQPRTTMSNQPQHRVMAPVAVVGLHGDI